MTTIDWFLGQNGFLSNFYEQPIALPDGTSAPSGEHLFQARKAADEFQFRWVLGAGTPREAKHRGRSLALPADWGARRLSVMRDVLALKFANDGLAARLLHTGDALLVEGNRWGDRFWGAIPGHGGRLEGENWLGHLLMARRAELRATATRAVW